MIEVGRFKIINEAKEEFKWIKSSSLDTNEKLKEMVELRNYLMEAYLFKDLTDNNIFRKKIKEIISEIDRCWWLLFKKGEDADEEI